MNVEKQLWISVLTSGTVSLMGTSCTCLMRKACGRDRKGVRLGSHPQKLDLIVKCSRCADLYILVVLGIGNGTLV